MSDELYKKYRPSTWKQVVGQADAVKLLEARCKTNSVPHSILFAGPSGTGKTTLARILKDKLECGAFDFREINCADFRGIEMVRDIRSQMSLAPMSGKCRVWLIDEAHKLSGDAQAAFLKILEDTPRHVYFFLCTTDPQKLIGTIISRCTEVKLRLLTGKETQTLVGNVCKKEGVILSEEVVDRLVDVAAGGARKALVLLDQITHLQTEEEQLEALLSSDAKAQAIEIARGLLNPRTSWAEMCKVLKTVQEEPETIRHIVLGYASSVMLGGNPKTVPRAFLILQAFRDHWYDCKKAGLIASCYEVITTK